MECKAATLAEARDVGLWTRAINLVRLELVKEVNAVLLEDAVGFAAVQAVPPDGEEAWPFAEGTGLDAHLLEIARRFVGRERKGAQKTRPDGRIELRGTRLPNPEQVALKKAADARKVAAIRARFADDPDVLAYFESLLRSDPAVQDAAPVGLARDLAMTRLRRFIATYTDAREEELLRKQAP